MSHNLLTEENWQSEAESVINDIKSHVRTITVSDQLASTSTAIYLNLTTLENKRFCIKLCGLGFCVVGLEHNRSDKVDDLRHFETPYSLLASISPSFHQSFGTELLEKLQALHDSSAT